MTKPNLRLSYATLKSCCSNMLSLVALVRQTLTELGTSFVISSCYSVFLQVGYRSSSEI